jgi:hypothetical protein
MLSNTLQAILLVHLYLILKGALRVLKNYDTVAVMNETFVVAGQTFTVRAQVPREALVKLGKIDDDDERVDAFFRAVLIKADRHRFLSLLHSEADGDDDPVITMAQANAIMSDLTEYATGTTEGKDDSSTPGHAAMPEQSNIDPLPSGVVSPYASGTSS